MENTVRNIIAVVAIIGLMVYFLPFRPPIGVILDNFSPFLIFIFILFGFFMKAKKEAKKKGIEFEGKNIQSSIINEIKKSFEAQKKRKN